MFIFAAYNATDYNPHFWQGGLRMKVSSVNLDRVLHRILTEEGVGCFTIMELRELYLRYVDPNGATPPQIRVYLYDQIRRMVDLGWAAYHSERRTRGQRFLINEMPTHVTLKLVAPKMGMTERQTTEKVPSDITEPPVNDSGPAALFSGNAAGRSPAVALQEMLKEVRLDFLTTLGATERYRLLIDEVPDLKSTLEPELAAARDNSSRLLGHMNAIEATLQKLGAV